MSASTGSSSGPSRVTTHTFRAKKGAPEPIVVVTAYDHPTARLVEAAGVDAILVGDSLGMTVLGRENTLSVGMEDMVRATSAVSRAVSRVLVIADMPFGSWQTSVEDGVRNAVRLVAEGGAHAVKIEGADAHTLEVIERVVDAGIPVMGHVGLTPQSVNAMGGYRTQGLDAESAMLVIEDALRVEESRAFSVVLECIPNEVADYITADLEIPTIGIGAGGGCDGQVQVLHDIIRLSERVPRHARRYVDVAAQIERAVAELSDDIRARRFPAAEMGTPAPKGLVREALDLRRAIFAAIDEIEGLER